MILFPLDSCQIKQIYSLVLKKFSVCQEGSRAAAVVATVAGLSFYALGKRITLAADTHTHTQRDGPSDFFPLSSPILDHTYEVIKWSPLNSEDLWYNSAANYLKSNEPRGYGPVRINRFMHVFLVAGCCLMFVLPAGLCLTLAMTNLL